MRRQRALLEGLVRAGRHAVRIVQPRRASRVAATTINLSTAGGVSRAPIPAYTRSSGKK
jgi:hypothetical protein